MTLLADRSIFTYGQKAQKSTDLLRFFNKSLKACILYWWFVVFIDGNPIQLLSSHFAL